MKTRKTILLIFGCLFLFTVKNPVIAQAGLPEKPPRPMTVSNIRSLSFGIFYHGASGGTVTIDAFGGRTVSGDVIAIGSIALFWPAVFEIDAEPGTMVTWLATTTTLTCTGGTMVLDIDAPANAYILAVRESGTLQVGIGGTLTVDGVASPPGSYSGSFSITFIQE